jgi:hypothetical protein
MSRDSDREVARCKREMMGCGKGDSPRPTNVTEFVNKYPECNQRRCNRLRMRGSDYCTEHATQLEESK